MEHWTLFPTPRPVLDRAIVKFKLMYVAKEEFFEIAEFSGNLNGV